MPLSGGSGRAPPAGPRERRITAPAEGLPRSGPAADPGGQARAPSSAGLVFRCRSGCPSPPRPVRRKMRPNLTGLVGSPGLVPAGSVLGAQLSEAARPAKLCSRPRTVQLAGARLSLPALHWRQAPHSFPRHHALSRARPVDSSYWARPSRRGPSATTGSRGTALGCPPPRSPGLLPALFPRAPVPAVNRARGPLSSPPAQGPLPHVRGWPVSRGGSALRSPQGRAAEPPGFQRASWLGALFAGARRPALRGSQRRAGHEESSVCHPPAAPPSEVRGLRPAEPSGTGGR